ncbi:hypothetical protein [Fodinibius sp. SL11]|uniref:hypothetical protein n=1 Tax=Fodinibius sp. SL11 TaxID=3425690 RepID=UPI003F882397
MALEASMSFGINDITGAPQARLHGGPFNDSVIELTDADAASITITEDGTQSTYYNSRTKNREDQLIFTCEES